MAKVPMELQDCFVEDFTFSSVTVPANSSTDLVTVLTDHTGFVPVSASLVVTSANTSVSVLNPQARNSSDNYRVRAFNAYNADVTISGTVHVLYVKI